MRVGDRSPAIPDAGVGAVTGCGVLCLGDAILDEPNFEHPDWVSVYASIPSPTVATRKALIEKTITEPGGRDAFGPSSQTVH